MAVVGGMVPATDKGDTNDMAKFRVPRGSVGATGKAYQNWRSVIPLCALPYACVLPPSIRTFGFVILVAVHFPRDPKASNFYACVDDNFEELERVYDELYSKQHGCCCPIIRRVIHEFLDEDTPACERLARYILHAPFNRHGEANSYWSTRVWSSSCSLSLAA